MNLGAVPLSELILLLPIASEVRLMRALRQQVDVACLRVPGRVARATS